MSVIFAYLFYFFASSLASLQIRWLTKKRDLPSSHQILFSFQVWCILFLGSLFFPFFSPFYISGGLLNLLLLFIVCGIFGSATASLSMVAQKHLDAGVSSILSNTYTPITIFLSSLLLNEGLSSVQIFGTVLLLLAVFLISKKHRIGKFKFDKYFTYALLGGLSLGILLVAERALQKLTGFTAGTMLSWGSQALFLGILAWHVGGKHAYKTKDVLYTGALRFIGSFSYVFLVYIAGNLSMVSAITTFKVIVMFIVGAVFLHEREDMPRKILGSLVALVGLLLMK
jgi:drug/metabolite transporter (DMT)-like permease